MRPPRLLLSLLALIIALAFPAAPSARAADQWTAAAALPIRGYDARAALLPDGRVYVRSDAVGAIYDPGMERWTRVRDRLDPREGAAMATLHSGAILLTGGRSCGRCGDNGVELYDPRTGAITFPPRLRQPRARHTATTLVDGRVLVAGGVYGPYRGPNTSTEIYDPATNSWAEGPPMLSGRLNHTATLLADGRVLVIGGATAEFYDPTSNGWTVAGMPAASRSRHTATLLADGSVLIAGGAQTDEAAPIGLGDRKDGPPFATVERYDPATDRWSVAAALPGPRAAHTATLLDDGQLLVAGGRATTDTQQALTTALRFDPAIGTWHDAGNLTTPLVGHAATLLVDGSVLAVGEGPGGTRVAQRYTDTAARLCALPTGGPETCVAGRFLTYWRAHGGLAINGYPLSPLRTETLEDGSSRVVQYFERTRLEWHPEATDPQYRILLGQFGRQVLAGVADAPTAPVAPIAGATHFAQTKHNVARAEFMAFWWANGGLAQFGFPLSEEFTERLEDGQEYRVQYFERARFEWHPANDDPNKIQLGQFGRRILAAR